MFWFKAASSSITTRSWWMRGATTAFISVLCAAVLGHDVVRAWETRTRALEQTRREVENLTWSACQHAKAAFQLVNASMIGLIERIEVDGTGPEQIEPLRHLMALQLAALPVLQGLTVLNEAGDAIVDANQITPKINVADRNYFQYHRAHSSREIYITGVFRSRISNRLVILVSRRLNHTDGSFAGTLTATIEAAYFREFYATFHLGTQGAAALWHDDGTLMVRQGQLAPRVTGDPNDSFSHHYVFPEAASGTLEVISSMDGFNKIMSYRRVQGFPLVVAMSLGKNEQLASWQADAVEHLIGAIVVTFVLGFFGLRLVTQIKHRENAIATASVFTATNERLEQLARHLAKARDRADQANRAKSRFLAGMSHELRTPLNGILGYAQLLHMDGDLNATQSARVSAMQGAGKHLLEMITCVLDLSEIEAEHVKLRAITFDLRAMAEACLDLIRPVAEANGLTLNVTMAPDLPQEMVADPTRLRQVLLNLIGNAVKFTAQGAITLRLRPKADNSILRIEVVDTGCGIPTEQRRHLFQDFERLEVEANCRIEGAGLGLALSARLVSLMDGRIGHDDNPGGGSVFWLEIPLNIPTISVKASIPTTNERDAQPSPSPPRALHVLVVDDVLMNRDIASSFLCAAGHKVTCAEDGEEAVAAATHTDFDVVLMDVRMPRMDGLEATRHIRALEGTRGQVPIVALTAQAFTDQVDMCRDAGMDSHLGKPFDMNTLLATVMAVVGVNHQPSTEHGSGGLLTNVPANAAIPPIEPQLPVLNATIFQQTAGFLKPDAVASYMRTIKELGETVLRGLDEPGAFTRASSELAKAAHTLAGSAGMFGFERLATTGRSFERAVQSQAEDTPALAHQLRAAVKATLQEIHN